MPTTQFSIGSYTSSGLQIYTDNTSLATIDDFRQLNITGNVVKIDSPNVIIGNGTQNTSSILQLNSTTKGFLPPKMTSVQANAIIGPIEGLMIYVTDTGGSPFNFTSKGWWGYNGATWTQLG